MKSSLGGNGCRKWGDTGTYKMEAKSWVVGEEILIAFCLQQIKIASLGATLADIGKNIFSSVCLLVHVHATFSTYTRPKSEQKFAQRLKIWTILLIFETMSKNGMFEKKLFYK